MTVIPNADEGPQAGPSASQLHIMKALPIWLLWRSEQNPDPSKKNIKVPYYAGGGRRSGELDSPEDRAKLVTFAEALAKFEALEGVYAGLAIALGPDGRGGFWQGIDLDAMSAAGTDDIADLWTRGACAGLGYVEMSPSGTGIHLIGYGRSFRALGSNSSGIEAYSGARFFTFTGRPIVGDSACQLYDLSDYVEQALAPRHGSARAAAADSIEGLRIDAKTVTELRSALLHMRADDRVLWVNMGHALKELGETGRGLWLHWSATSDKLDPKDAAEKWSGFDPRRTGYQAVFAEAQRQGWVNPASAAAQGSTGKAEPSPDDAPTFSMEFAMSTDTATSTLEYLEDPWLPLGCVVGFFGRGSTAKSSLLATLAARISARAVDPASTLWVSVEEPAEWIKVRHIACGGAEKTLLVVTAVESKRDKEGRVVASSFNIHEHLEPAIIDANARFASENSPPLRQIVLDTAVGLTAWGRGESPNDDAAVKKLLARLQALAEQYKLTIAVVGHANKGTHDHLADTVMGATAWTNSPRLSFLHAEDRREEYAFVVRTAKTNLSAFGAPYRTEPVHTLHHRDDAPDSVLVKVAFDQIVWGGIASLEMFTDATKKPRDDNEEGDEAPTRGPSLAQIVVETLVEMTQALETPLQYVTREEVQTRLGKEVDRKRWGFVEHYLSNHPQVVSTRGEKNRAEYRRRL